MNSKVFPDAASALADLPDGVTMLSGGFGLCGIPQDCILALRDLGRRDLTVVSNNAGTTDSGWCSCSATTRSAKVMASYVGENDVFEQLMLAGSLEVELVPQGTLAERMRAGGPAFPASTPPRASAPLVADGQGDPRVRRPGVHPRARHPGEFALVRAWKGDRLGQPGLPQDGAEFQSAGGDGGTDHGGRGGGAGRAGHARPRRDPHPGRSTSSGSAWPRECQAVIERRTVREAR